MGFNPFCYKLFLQHFRIRGTYYRITVTSYNGQTITYDAIGNPLNYRDGISLTWQNGRELTTLSNDSYDITFSYDASGMRTKKSIEGVGDTEYVYEGGQLLQMQYLYYIFDFSYGADGRAVGFSVTNTDDMSKSFFYYALNSRGDVIALYNSAGTKICTYSYDAYGKLLSTSLFSNTSSDRIASNFNPLRYRSYVYDRETGFYYLQTRYYDPVTCRFVNGDCQLNIDTFTGYNQFAYCDNMPTNCSDPTGTSFVRESAGGYYCGFPGISYGGTGISSGGGGARVGYNVPVTYNYITRPSSGLIALAPVGIVVGLGTADLLAEMFYLKKANRTATAETELTTTNNRKNDYSKTYYHVTSQENAHSIMKSNLLYGSSWEGGYVYAWKRKPNHYAIKNSGAHFGVIISFETYASFSMDPGISDAKVLIYGPVVSSLPGPIRIKNVKIVG